MYCCLEACIVCLFRRVLCAVHLTLDDMAEGLQYVLGYFCPSLSFLAKPIQSFAFLPLVARGIAICVVASHSVRHIPEKVSPLLSIVACGPWGANRA